MEIEHNQKYNLPEGHYYHEQIIGLKVRTTQGKLLGNVSTILSGKSNDNYVIQTPEGEILIPAIEDIIKSVDIKEGFITIEAVEGLLNLNKKKPPK